MLESAEESDFIKPVSLLDDNQEYLKYYQSLLESETTSEHVKTDVFSPNTPYPHSLSEAERKIDPKCIHTIKKRLVRLQYPGIVRNLSKAIETLGGLQHIEMAVAEHGHRLYLNFHPENKFNKGCFADRNQDPGLLLKVTMKTAKHPGCSNQPDISPDPTYDFQVLGTTAMNFQFNRLVDFQQLPLVAEYPESIQSTVAYLHDSIIPQNMPSLGWLLKKESQTMPLYFTPIMYARFDNSKQKLYVSAVERFHSKMRPEIAESFKATKTTTKTKPDKIVAQVFGRSYTKKHSIFHYFNDPEVPEGSTGEVNVIIKRRNLGDALIKTQRYFEERPIWTKAGLQYNSKLPNETLKVILPAVAYYFVTGPWRSTWVRYGYDPRKDPNARIYQNLDYRIRTTIGTNLKIEAKRTYTSKTIKYYDGSSAVKRISLKDNVARKPKFALEERSYILKPNVIPPARQMFYQYCDIMLPEVQTMLARLPQVPSVTKCDPKNGWLPASFVEQCREIVNRYVSEQVQTALLEDTQPTPEIGSTKFKDITTLKVEPQSSDYCSLMIKNIKRGIYKKLDLTNTARTCADSNEKMQKDDLELPLVHCEDVTEILDSDEEMYETHLIVDNIPERIEEESDEEDEYSEILEEENEIDMDALEDVRNIISGSIVKLE